MVIPAWNPEDDMWFADDEEPDEMDLFEQALQDCGLNAGATWCDLAGTSHCDFHCPFRAKIPH